MSSGPSKVIVLDPDQRAGRQVQLGFEREGMPTVAPEIPADPDKLDWDGEPAGIVLVGGKDSQAVALVRRAKQLLKAKGADVPIVCTGTGPRRELEAAGADEVLARPAFLRDVVTVARVMRGVPSGQRDHLVGSLAETTGVLTLVRALSTLGRSAVLTLIRGLRRGEVRFYRGEVTSAQVGLIHGQAALHQLLLWTDARFDFSHEDIVRRQQIPLSSEELYKDAEQFLEGVREHAGQLSPATVLEQDVVRIQTLGKKIPTEVHGVLRMFDGHRVLADILEDSPYRVFETLRVTQKAVEVGLLKPLDSQRPKATWRAVLAIEEWLVGNETREAVVERTAALDSGPTPSPRKKGKGKRRSKKMKAVEPPIEAKNEIDWGALVPRVIGAEVGPLSGVVPAQETHGEVELPTRDKPREGLEALMDTDKRQKIFPTDIGLEPKVVIDAGETTDEWEKAEWEAKEKALAEEKAAAERARVQADQKAKADAYVLSETAAKLKAEAAKHVAIADTPPAGFATVKVEKPELSDEQREIAALQAKVPENLERMRIAQREREEADAKAKEEATRNAAAEEAKNYAAKVKAAAEAKRVEAEAKQREDAAKVELETKRERETARIRALETKPAPEATPKAIVETGSAPVTVDTQTASLVAVPTQAPTRSDPAAAVSAVKDEPSAPRQRKPSGTDAGDLVKALVSEAVPRTESAAGSNGESATKPTADVDPALRIDAAHVVSARNDVASSGPAPKTTLDSPSEATTKPIRPVDDAVTTPFIKPSIEDVSIAEPILLKESPATSVAVTDVVTVKGKGDTAIVTAKPAVMISETPETALLASTAPALAVSSKDDATPQAAEDEPSDGVIRSMIASADTARERLRARPPTPEHDGPAIKETTGEIRPRQPKSSHEPAVSEPSILVADLAAAHDAIAAVAMPAAPPPGDAASASRELEVSDVRRDAVAFSEEEEAFFKKADKSVPVARVEAETFEDLDEGYQPQGFWDKVFGRKPNK